MTSLKDLTIEIFHEPDFKFYGWHSNVPTLNGKELENEIDQTFAKQQLDMKSNKAIMLGFIGFYRY